MAHHGLHPEKCRLQAERKEVFVDSSPRNDSLGFSFGSERRFHPSAPRKIEDCEERVGKNCEKGSHDLQKNGCHSWSGAKFFGGPPLFEGLHGHHGPIYRSASTVGVGCPTSSSNHLGFTNKRSKTMLAGLARPPFHTQGPPPSFALRFQHNGLGRFRCPQWGGCSKMVESKPLSSHQREGTSGSNFYGTQPGSAGGIGRFICRQHRCLHISHQGRGTKITVQHFPSPLPAVVHSTQGDSQGSTGAFCRNVSRSVYEVENGPRRLHFGSPPFPVLPSRLSSPYSAQSGHFCVPWQSTVTTVRGTVAPFSGSGSQRSSLPVGTVHRGVCQPTLDHAAPVVASLARAPPSQVSSGLPILGFRHMVAPINAPRGSSVSMSESDTIPGNVHQLHGAVYASAKVAPDLCAVIRKLLEEQKIPPPVVGDHLAQLTQLPRYDSAFKLLWGFLKHQGFDPVQCSPLEVAAAIVSIAKVSLSQARNAYSAMLLVPGFSLLKFQPLLAPCKRQWNAISEKYATFWDPSFVLRQLLVEFAMCVGSEGKGYIMLPLA